MRYQDQKKIFYLQLFIGMLLLGYNAGKLLKNGFDTSTVDIPLALAVGIVLPLAGYFGLRRVKATEQRQKALAANADNGTAQDC